MKRPSRRPGRPTARWTIAVAAFVLVAVPIVAQMQFSDVPEDHPRRADIAFVAERGAFQGYPDGTFRPERNITPEQMTTVLRRAFPDGMTRAVFASMLRNGYEQAAPTPTDDARAAADRLNEASVSVGATVGIIYKVFKDANVEYEYGFPITDAAADAADAAAEAIADILHSDAAADTAALLFAAADAADAARSADAAARALADAADAAAIYVDDAEAAADLAAEAAADYDYGDDLGIALAVVQAADAAADAARAALVVDSARAVAARAAAAAIYATNYAAVAARAADR